MTEKTTEVNDHVKLIKENEKKSLELLSSKDKLRYLASQKRTWVTIGTVVAFAIEKDYVSAFTTLLNLFGL